MSELVCEKDLRVTCPKGKHTVLFKANVTRDVPEHLVDMCRSNGAFPPNGISGSKSNVPAVPVETPEMEQGRIDSLAEVVQEIYAEGKEELLTTNGIPKLAEIKKRSSIAVSKEDLLKAVTRYHEINDGDNASE